MICLHFNESIIVNKPREMWLPVTENVFEPEVSEDEDNDNVL